MVALAIGLSLFSLQNRCYVLKARPGAGMFSMFTDVLVFLNSYENQEIGGLHIAFGKEGVYYSADRGDNWWEYYCEPIEIGKKMYVEKGYYGEVSHNPEREFWKNRRQAHALIKKYIRFKPFIIEKVNRFCSEHFKDKVVITVHYRGTDWFPENEFDFISYDRFSQEVQKVVSRLSPEQDYQIFIATDENGFIDYMKSKFASKVCFLEECHRANDSTPLHKDASYNPAQQGEEAILDCLLLSKGDYFIGTCSNLSQWALFLNPEMQAVDLSRKLSWIDQ